MSLNDIVAKVKQRHATMKEIARLQALANRGYPGHEPRIALLQDQLKQSFSSSPQQQEKPFVPYSAAPQGSANWDADIADRQRSEQESSIQIQQLVVPVTATGLIPGFNPFFCTADGIQVIARTQNDNGVVTESSPSARLFIRINSPTGMWLPIGFTLSPETGAKGDTTVFMGVMKKFWLYCSEITLDPNFPSVVMALLHHVSIVAPSGGSNLYGSPANPGAGAPIIAPSSSAGGGTSTATTSPTSPTGGSGFTGGGGGGDRSGGGGNQKL